MCVLPVSGDHRVLVLVRLVEDRHLAPHLEGLPWFKLIAVELFHGRHQFAFNFFHLLEEAAPLNLESVDPSAQGSIGVLAVGFSGDGCFS